MIQEAHNRMAPHVHTNPTQLGVLTPLSAESSEKHRKRMNDAIQTRRGPKRHAKSEWRMARGRARALNNSRTRRGGIQRERS